MPKPKTSNLRPASLAGRSPQMVSYFKKMQEAGWITRSQIRKIPGALYPDTYRDRLRSYKKQHNGRLPPWARRAPDGTILYSLSYIRKSKSFQFAGMPLEETLRIKKMRASGWIPLSEVAQIKGARRPNTYFVRARNEEKNKGMLPPWAIRTDSGMLFVKKSYITADAANAQRAKKQVQQKTVQQKAPSKPPAAKAVSLRVRPPQTKILVSNEKPDAVRASARNCSTVAERGSRR